MSDDKNSTSPSIVQGEDAFIAAFYSCIQSAVLTGRDIRLLTRHGLHRVNELYGLIDESLPAHLLEAAKSGSNIKLIALSSGEIDSSVIRNVATMIPAPGRSASGSFDSYVSENNRHATDCASMLLVGNSPIRKKSHLTGSMLLGTREDGNDNNYSHHRYLIDFDIDEAHQSLYRTQLNFFNNAWKNFRKTINQSEFVSHPSRAKVAAGR